MFCAIYTGFIKLQFFPIYIKERLGYGKNIKYRKDIKKDVYKKDVPLYNSLTV